MVTNNNDNMTRNMNMKFSLLLLFSFVITGKNLFFAFNYSLEWFIVLSNVISLAGLSHEFCHDFQLNGSSSWG